MTQMSKDVDMDAALSALATLSANVEAISESDALKELVHSIPVGYSVYDDVNIIGSVLNEKYRDDFLDVDMRDTYAKMMEAAVQVQACLKQMYDIAMFLKVSDAVNVFEDEN